MDLCTKSITLTRFRIVWQHVSLKYNVNVSYVKSIFCIQLCKPRLPDQRVVRNWSCFELVPKCNNFVISTMYFRVYVNLWVSSTRYVLLTHLVNTKRILINWIVFQHFRVVHKFQEQWKVWHFIFSSFFFLF